MTGILDWLNVGEVSAERDQNLASYFYDAGVSKNIIANPKQYLLLGRKGAGKTAVFLHLTRKPADLFKTDDLVVGLSLQSYNWQAHQLLIDAQKEGGFQHRDSWRFVLYLETVKAVVTHLKNANKEVPKRLERAAAILEKLFSTPVPSWTDLLGEKIFGLGSFELPGFDMGADKFSASGGKISFEEVKEKNDLRTRMNRNIGTLTNWLEDCLYDIPAEIRVFLVFDRLDEGWVASFIEQSKTIISGLLHASEHVLGAFKGKIRPIVFLREDIFWSFDINDKNKFREDCSDSLRWSPESIEKLILTRINFYAGLSGQKSLASLQDLFQEKEMRSRTAPVKHLFNRTMCRPRDMVAFLRRTFQAAKDDNLVSDDGGKLSTKAIYAAEPGYSEYLYDELSDEWRTQNPAFSDYLAAIENLKYATFKPADYYTALEKKQLAGDLAESRKIVRFLFDNSILGITVGESKQWRYKCFYPNQGFDDTGYLKVHPGLIKRLGLTEGSAGEQAPELAPE